MRLVFISLLLTTLASCTTDDTVPEYHQPRFVGTWEFRSVILDGETRSEGWVGRLLTFDMDSDSTGSYGWSHCDYCL